MKSRAQYKGIWAERKENLITKLKPIMLATRLAFWESLPVSNNDNKL